MHKTANPRKLGVALFGMLLFAAPSTHAQTAPPSRAQTAPPTHAQTAPRTVRIEEPGGGTSHFLLPPINLEVIKAFSARIAASEGYALTDSPAELVVTIICLDSRKESLAGGVCTYRFEYRSKKIPEFNMPLGTPSPVVRSEASEIAEYIFQDFVRETTETKLSVAELEATFRVANFCSKPANQLPCSGKFQ
jgi:hypothetical protein